ncbi:MAG: carboxypeptidase regulatory-like domain-containing protein [Verrucomicrobia bacterium]|nr:carboxypeptidase regulatory-like domain-containing protein [Verrucomicrobiota bacterium]
MKPESNSRSGSEGRSRSQTGAPARTVSHRRIQFLLLLVASAGLCLTTHAEQGQGTSALFTVDTRWGFSEGAAVSGFFAVDTRLSGSAGAGVSGLFTTDTTGASVGSAMFAGYVTDSVGAGLAGAMVTALQSSVVRGQVGTDSSGYYQLSALSAGTFQLRAEKANYLTGLRNGLNLAANQTWVEHFALAGKPAGLLVETVDREAESSELPTVSGPQLKVFVDGQFVVGGPFDPAKPTVIMTHGWNSNPQVWAQDMAAKMLVGGANANILSWDWKEEADTGARLSKALSATPREGAKLGQTLAATFTGAYNQGVHFIGHSLGTLVNAEAANYLHERTGGTFNWLRSKTHMTLLDNAAIANVEGTVVQLGYTLLGVEVTYDVGGIFTIGWISPVPRQRAWIDNYISLVGIPHPQAVNVWLAKAPDYGDRSNPKVFIESVHGYAARWYANSAAAPLVPTLGNRFSYEQMGSGAIFPSPSPFALGSLFSQDILSMDEMVLVPLDSVVQINAIFARQAASFRQVGLQSLGNFTAGTMLKAGQVSVDIAESFIPHTPPGSAVFTGTAGSTPAYYTDSGVEQTPVWSFQVNLTTSPLLPRPDTIEGGPDVQAAGDSDPEAPRVWIPVAVPSNAVLFAFDFEFNGEAAEDLFSMSIAGTNMFALEAKFMPTNTTLNSGPIDVSAWSGQTVEFFFGLLGDTTNANVEVSGMRFYYIEAPRLTAEVVGNELLVSWPATTEGYTLESATSVTETNQWSAVQTPPALVGLRNVVTNSLTGDARFFRLKR